MKTYKIAGYNFVTRREHNAIGGSGGSPIQTRHDIQEVFEIEEVKERFKYDGVLGIELKETISWPGVKVFTYYNPPLCAPNKLVFQYIASSNGCCVLKGNLNCKSTMWGSSKNEKRGNDLLDMLNDMGLFIFNDDSKTRCDPVSGKEDSLDMGIGNNRAQGLFKEFWVGLDVGSDHFPVHTTLQFKNKGSETPEYIRRVQDLNLN